MSNTLYMTIFLVSLSISLYLTIKNPKMSKIDSAIYIGLGIGLTIDYFFNPNPYQWEWQKNLTRIPEVIAGLYFIGKGILGIQYNIFGRDKQK